MNRRHIFLTGFMGCGKSTVGPKVAGAIGFKFVDLDREIEAKEGKSVAEIFNVSGESYFRSLEYELIIQLLGEGDTVFALGGGTLTIEGITPLLKTHGILIYLYAETEDLVLRLREYDHRPLLSMIGKGESQRKDLRERIEFLLSGREPYYREADIILSTSGIGPEKVAENILNSIATELN